MTYQAGNDFAQLSTSEVSFLLNSLNLKENSKHLDIGCGTGALVRDLYMRGFQSIGIDTSKEAIESAIQSVNPSLGEMFFHASVEEVGECDFTIITAKYLYKFIDDRDTFLLNVKRILKKDGFFIIIDPVVEHLPEPKKNIVLPEEVVLGELSAYFTVSVRKYRKNVYYFAR